VFDAGDGSGVSWIERVLHNALGDGIHILE
jgi:hypothetical protein